ncbi:MAG: prenyltransferase/squalene oxidase repeat-containing protein [Planctomycetaceae bacterium]
MSDPQSHSPVPGAGSAVRPRARTPSSAANADSESAAGERASASDGTRQGKANRRASGDQSAARRRGIAIRVEQTPEQSLAERIEREAKRGVPGMLASVAFHVMLLFLLWLVVVGRQHFGEDSGTEFGWINTEALRTERAAPGPIKLPGLPNRPSESAEESEDAEAKANEGGGPPRMPVEPVRVTELLDGRSDSRRTQLIEQAGGNQRTEQTIKLSLGWIVRQQQGRGNWQLHQGYPDASEPTLRTDTGATGLALLALLGAGHTHRAGEQQAAVAQGLEWLLEQQNRRGPPDEFDGNFHDRDEYGLSSTYYAHSQATIALCEAYALTGDEALREPAERAVAFLLRSQHPQFGGWKYMPMKEKTVGDLSVTGWALMALHTARASGIDISNDDFYRASTFLDSVEEQGGARYKYMPFDPSGNVTVAMTAEGLLCRQYLGWPRDYPPLEDGVRWLLSEENRPRWEAGTRNVYAWYYQAQVLHNMGGDAWRDWYGHTQAIIVERQVRVGNTRIRGSWNPTTPYGSPHEYASSAGRLYFTAMCALVLQTPYRHASVYAAP